MKETNGVVKGSVNDIEYEFNNDLINSNIDILNFYMNYQLIFLLDQKYLT